MAREEVAAIFTKDFVPVMIDVDLMPGGKEVMARYAGDYGGLPTLFILDPDGSVVADSFNQEGRNIGSPYDDWEIEYFGVMMKEGTRRISAEEIQTLLDSLVAARENQD